MRTGNMNVAPGVRRARGGHQVPFGSRDRRKAEAAAADAGPGAQVGDFDAAAAFGEASLYTLRLVLPSRLLQRPELVGGKVLIDCDSSAILGLDIPHPVSGRTGLRFPSSNPSLAERLAEDVAGARVVKAFNTVPAQVISLHRQRLEAAGVSVFLCGDDPRAKLLVRGLVEELGFTAVDCGPLERAPAGRAAADPVRSQILTMGEGPLTYPVASQTCDGICARGSVVSELAHEVVVGASSGICLITATAAAERGSRSSS